MLKTRKIVSIPAEGGGYRYYGLFGHGNAEFVYGGEALAQILTHKILTVRGELKLRRDFGVSYYKRVPNANDKKLALDIEIRSIIQDDPYVERIESFNSRLDNGIYSLNCVVYTSFGLLRLEV